MKLGLSSGSCRVEFEEGDAFAGKSVLLSGELVPDGFLFHPHKMDWMTDDIDGTKILDPVEDEFKDALIDFIIKEGRKRNMRFSLWI